MDASVADRIAAAKKRIEQMTAKAANPYLSGSGSMAKNEPKTNQNQAPVGVTSIALHPLLMGGQQQQEAQMEKNEKKALRDRYKPMAPKFSSVKANINHSQAAIPANRQAPASSIVINPYSSAPAAAAAGTSADAGAGGDKEAPNPRRSRKLNFSAQGKYVKQGDVLRNEAKMDALRQRIAEASKKAGLDSEFDTLERSLKVSPNPRVVPKHLFASHSATLVLSRNSLQRQPPPDVEWWDKALLPEAGTYDDIDKAMAYITTSEDTLVTHLIQHPIPIPAPGDKKTDERGLMLTKKEQKKMRRQRRQAELEDKRDRQKMGLLPPDPPKGKSSGMILTLSRILFVLK
jgi:U4/U6 small nuclear ribonucleoprotein PRP3